ncbi:MAG: dihydroneopterin aldolase [Crocinitomicaceae bacterium]|nr:dihydroneopterin aldolase [Crocinitomicaceae bacterium]
MKHRIEVNGIKCYAHHGCLEEEAKIGGHYIVDVSLTTDFSLAMQTDDLSQTVCYVDINTIVKEEMAIRSKLIEHVGGRIFNRIKNELENIHQLSVKIVKICPPINGDVDDCSIIIED